MKEELIKNIAGVVDYIRQGAEFVKEQAPLFIQEYLTFKTYLLLFWESVLFMLLVSSITYGLRCRKRLDDDDDDFYGTMMIICGAVCIVSFVGFVCCGEELIKILVAPRVFIVDHLLGN